MSDNETRPAAHELAKALLNESLTFRVKIASGFVENQQFRIRQDGAGDRQSLPLAAAQSHATLADQRLHSVGHAVDELRGIGGFGGRMDFLGGRIPPCVGDVLSDRAVEQKDILLDDSQQRAKRFDVIVAQISSIQRHATRIRIVKTGYQIGERGFAGAAGTDQCAPSGRRALKG